MSYFYLIIKKIILYFAVWSWKWPLKKEKNNLFNNQNQKLMKKIYALIAVAAAGVMTASAFTGMPFEGGKKVLGEPIPFSKAAEQGTPDLKDAKTFTLKGFSRADGDVTITPELISSFNQGLGYVYKDNWMDENGNKSSEFRYNRACALTDIVASEDLNEIYIKNYFGVEIEGDGIKLEFNAENGNYEMELNQVILKHSKYGDITFAAELGEDLVTEGKVPFKLYLNCLAVDTDAWPFDGGWLYAVAKVGGDFTWFSDLTVFYDIQFFQPNAIMQYTFTNSKGDQNVNKGVIFEEIEPNPQNPNDLGGYLVSCVSPYDGYVTYFDNVLLQNGDLVIMPDGAPVSGSERVSATEYTGDFYMVMLNKEENMVMSPELFFADFDINNNTFKWPVLPEIFAQEYGDDFVGYDYWTIYSEAGYNYGSMTPATIYIGDGSGSVSSAVVEEVAGPAEYYNLQGIKVANPAAGQIYIVKEGSKVSKRVF